MQHTPLLEAILADFKKRNVQFEGAIEWYMEGVKLDLEATRVILRIPDKPPYQWLLAPAVP
nr:hypothetical protein [Paraflavitalea speifideiaquila]